MENRVDLAINTLLKGVAPGLYGAHVSDPPEPIGKYDIATKRPVNHALDVEANDEGSKDKLNKLSRNPYSPVCVA